MSFTSLAPVSNLLWKYFEHEGVDPAPIYRKAGINPELLKKENARINIEQLQKLWEQTESILSDSCFSVKMVNLWHPSMMGALGYAWLASSSLRTALNRVVRYSSVVAEDLIFQVKETPMGLKMSLNFKETEFVHPQRHDIIISVIMHLSRINFGETLVPTEVHLAHSEPNCSEAFSDYFRTDINFDAKESSITIARNDADKILNPERNQMSLMHDDALMKCLVKVKQGDIVQQVKSIILENLPDGQITDSHVAKKMNMSERSLQRRLNEKKTSYRSLLDSVREMVAVQYIKNPSTSMKEIAFLLGFSEQSAFSRAFKKWTGISPVQYRQSLQS